MLRIGLTGGIASGKSTVREIFEQSGIPMLDADALAHALIAPGGDLVEPIAERFGPGVLAESGGVHRTALGARVFRDDAARRWLNRLMHPAIRRGIEDFLHAREADGAAAAGVEAALMIETGSAAIYDRVVVVLCRPEQQFERLSARPGMTASEARLRIAAQMTPEEKAARGTDVLDATGALEATRANAATLAARLLDAAGGATGHGSAPRA